MGAVSAKKTGSKRRSGQRGDPRTSGRENTPRNEISGCIRKMTNIERVYYRFPGCNVALIARISGDLSVEKLNRALDAVSRIHPFLKARVVVDEGHVAWFFRSNISRLPLRVVPMTSDTQWFSEMQSEQRIPFDLEKGPLIRFVLVHSPELSDLVIICNHSICDGMALANLVRDILENYENPGRNNAEIPPPVIRDLLPGKNGFSLKTLLKRGFARYGNRSWRKSPHYFTQADYEAVTQGYWEKMDYGAVLFSLEPDEVDLFSARCRKEGVSIGSAVTLACIAAHEEIEGPFTGSLKNILIPFDLRRHTDRPVGDVFSLCVGGVQFPFRYQPGKPFWDNAARLHNEIHSRVEKLDSAGMEVPDFDPSFIDAFACFAMLAKTIPDAFTRTENLSRFIRDAKNIAFKFADNSEKMIPGTIASNLGRLTIPEAYGDLRLERGIFLPAVSASVPLMLGGVSLGGRLVYSLTYVEPAGGPYTRSEMMLRIRNKALEYIGFPGKGSETTLA